VVDHVAQGVEPIEGRVPFLDTEFLDTAMRIAPEAKRPRNGRIEKC